MYSYEGIGVVAVTMEGKNVETGCTCSVSAGNKVSSSQEDQPFHGVILWSKGSVATVQIRGFVTVWYSGSAPQVGYQQLVSDGMGGVKVGAGNGENPSRLVVAVDPDNATVTFLM